MELNKKDAFIGVGVVAGAAVLVLFLRGKGGSASTQSGGATDIMGGFSTAGTVYVPTSSYDLQYNTYKGAVTYSTQTNNNNSQTTTTYAPAGGTGGTAVSIPDAHIPLPPTITTGSGSTVNPVKQPVAAAPAPIEPITPLHPSAPSVPKPTITATPKSVPFKNMGTMHYATPSGGWNSNSVVDYVKEHGGYSDLASRTILAKKYGITNYTGTAAQNATFLSKLKTVYGNK